VSEGSRKREKGDECVLVMRGRPELAKAARGSHLGARDGHGDEDGDKTDRQDRTGQDRTGRDGDKERRGQRETGLAATQES
jgi:hypothetical protein